MVSRRRRIILVAIFILVFPALYLTFVLTPLGGPACVGCPGDTSVSYTYCLNSIGKIASVQDPNSSFKMPEVCREAEDSLEWVEESDGNITLVRINQKVVVQETGEKVLELER